MVESPGKFAFRGGIVDVFPAEAVGPGRIESRGDRGESLWEFDPDTQRSVNPVTRITLPPLVESMAPVSVDIVGDGDAPEKLPHEFPDKWGAQTIFDLVARPLVILDEPAAIEEASRKFAEKIAESSAANGEEDAAARFALKAVPFQQ